MTSEVGSEVVGEAVEDRRGRVGQKEKKMHNFCWSAVSALALRGRCADRCAAPESQLGAHPVRRTGKSTWCASGAPHRFLPVRQCSVKNKIIYFLPEYSKETLRVHGVWKSQKKSHSTLPAKRATFTFLSGQKLIKNAKNDPFWRVFENLKLAVKQCYQTGQF